MEELELLPLLLYQPNLVIQFTAQLTHSTKSLKKEVGFQRQLQSLQIVGVTVTAAALVHRLISLSNSGASPSMT